jgi:hypothetical protein
VTAATPHDVKIGNTVIIFAVGWAPNKPLVCVEALVSFAVVCWIKRDFAGAMYFLKKLRVPAINEKGELNVEGALRYCSAYLV